MSQVLKSFYGRDAGLTKDGVLLSRYGFRAGADGIEFDYPSPYRQAILEDFCGAGVALSTTIAAQGDSWRSRKGSDGACVDWTVTPGVNGEVVGTIGNTTASMAVSGVQLDSGLSWKPNQGGLIYQARVKLSRITNIAAFIGLTDQTAALEMPIQSAASANTITTNATDGIGFMFDTSMTGQNWWLVGVANDVDATSQAMAIGSGSAIAPVANTYAYFRIEVNTDGSALFYYNGVQVGTKLSGAATATVALTPVVAGFNRTTTGAPTITVDNINVAANRV